MNCEICNQEIEDNYPHHWILEYVGYENLKLCEDCDLSLREQIGDDIIPFIDFGMVMVSKVTDVKESKPKGYIKAKKGLNKLRKFRP